LPFVELVIEHEMGEQFANGFVNFAHIPHGIGKCDPARLTGTFAHD
jgi:hypothetical protein